MAMEMPPCAYMDPRLGNSARVVLAFLYMHINRMRGDMFVYWPVRRIAKHIHGRIPASIRRDISTLQKSGYIEKATIPVKGAMREGWTILVAEGVHDVPGYTVYPGSLCTRGGTGCTHGGVQVAPPVNTEENTEPNLEERGPSQAPTAAGDPAPDNFALDPAPPKLKSQKKPAGLERAAIKALWAQHQAFRHEAQECLGKPKRSQGLTSDVEKRLLALIAGGFTEDQLLDAWRQARNEAIRHPHERNRKNANPLHWFNGATELRPETVTRLSGQYDGKTAAEAAQQPTTMIGQVTPHWSGSVAMAVTHMTRRPNTPEEDAGLQRAQEAADEADRDGTSIF